MSEPVLTAESIFPSLTVNDLGTSIRFYVDGLGFEIVDKSVVDGVLRFVMMRAGNIMLGIGQDDFAKGNDRVKGVGSRFWVRTDQDLEALAERATSAGLTLDFGPGPLPCGPMAFGFTDPDGFVFTVVNEG